MRVREDDATHAGCSTRHRIRRPLLTSVPRVWPTVAPRRLQCFVDAYDRRIVYLDVAEPLSFYFDLFLITFMLGIALAFAVCIAYQHRNALMRALRAGRHALFPAAPASGAVTDDELGERQRTPVQQQRQRAVLTPGSIKSAYQQVVKGFTEMV